MRFLVLLAGLALLPSAAGAVPVFLPTQDVAVSYSLSAPGQAPLNVELRYDAAGRRARIDAPAGYYVLGDLPAGQAELVLPSLHAVVRAPDFSSLTGEIMRADGAQFTRLGEGRYAGLDCENYLVLDRGVTGTACLTASGVVLHFAGHDAHGRAEGTALAVTYAPLPPDLFAPPSGYTPLNLPPGAVASLLRQENK